MGTLKELFEERDEAFKQQTFKIFELIHTTLVCVTEYLNSIDPVFAAGQVAWEDANLMDGMVLIVGIVDYTPGTQIEIEGETITITESNLDYFQRVVHMSLPFELVESSNEANIIEFLKMIHEKQKAESFSTPINDTPPPDDDFDLSQLTEEQRQAYMLFNTKGKS